ncbi:unnamed protein product [Heligmosomoides polygyrus]|uniref:Gag-pol polyprotein n=1 Tax=Heligmosomoides polygyrus TaxID=6339 RepID=A0A183FWU5_HELPZ|nr:unnamed protein product [Heligmosomoides polygyrus]
MKAMRRRRATRKIDSYVNHHDATTLKCGPPLDKESSREEIKLTERMASILKDFEARQLEVVEDEQLEVVEEDGLAKSM